jgi:predicted TIM-barrel fold metal-dependent hydrolase
MQIVDAQVHLWGTGLPSNLAHRQVTHFTPEEAIVLMDEGGVDAAVIHPPGWDPNSTDMAFKAVRNYPGRFAIMGAVPLDRPDSRARIAGWREQPGMLGLRYGFLHDPARRWLSDGTLDWLWSAAETANVPIAALATDSLTDLGRIAERHPGLRLTIDHLGGRGGLTTLKDAAAMTHMPELLALAKFPQCGGEGDRRTGLFQRALSVSGDAHVSATDLRCIWSASNVLGHGHHEDALFVGPVRDDVHRGTAVAQRSGQATDHG